MVIFIGIWFINNDLYGGMLCCGVVMWIIVVKVVIKCILFISVLDIMVEYEVISNWKREISLLGNYKKLGF